MAQRGRLRLPSRCLWVPEEVEAALVLGEPESALVLGEPEAALVVQEDPSVGHDAKRGLRKGSRRTLGQSMG